MVNSVKNFVLKKLLLIRISNLIKANEVTIEYGDVETTHVAIQQEKLGVFSRYT